MHLCNRKFNRMITLVLVISGYSFITDALVMVIAGLGRVMLGSLVLSIMYKTLEKSNRCMENTEDILYIILVHIQFGCLIMLLHWLSILI